MTEEQKRELERQANNYSFAFFDRKKDGFSTDIPNIKFISLSCAVKVLGYKFVEDCKAEMFGVEYKKFKLVEMGK